MPPVRNRLLRAVVRALDGVRRRALHAQLGSAGHGSHLSPSTVVNCPQWLRLGARTTIDAAMIHAQGGVTIGDDVLIGAGVVIASATHPNDPGERRIGQIITAPVVIEDGAWVCANATILPGVTLGRDCIVAAGAVVTRDVPPGATVYGVPATERSPAGMRSAREA